MIGAGLIAKKACEFGMEVKPWIKTSLAPGSAVVSKYLFSSGLQEHLDELGFQVVGYGCTTCIGNSGELDESAASAITENGVDIDFEKEPIGKGKNGIDVYLNDIRPSAEEIAEKYKADGHDMIVLAGADYGSGSSRDWDAKGTMLLGIKAVIAKSFERIYRSNLVGMGVIPLCFKPGQDADSLGLTGHERYTIDLPSDINAIEPGQDTPVLTDTGKSFTCVDRFDTENYIYSVIQPIHSDGIRFGIIAKLPLHSQC